MVKKQEVGGIQPMTAYPAIEFVTTGVPSLDQITNGGYPKGRVTEIYGKKSVGKTTIVMMMLAAISKDHKTLLVDSENALNVSRLIELGGEVSNIDFSTLSVLEDIGQLILDNLNKYDVIILDSVAGTITNTEMSSAVGDHNVGVKGKVMNSIFSRRLPELLAKSGCALILINQLRDSFSMYGDKTYTPGGKAIEYAASLRIELNTLATDRIIKDGVRVGHHVTATITKSKIGRPHQQARFTILY